MFLRIPAANCNRNKHLHAGTDTEAQTCFILGLVPSYHLGKCVLFCSPLCFPGVGSSFGVQESISLSAHLSLVLSGRSCWGRCGIRGQRGCHRPSDRRWVETLFLQLPPWWVMSIPLGALLTPCYALSPLFWELPGLGRDTFPRYPAHPDQMQHSPGSGAAGVSRALGCPSHHPFSLSHPFSNLQPPPLFTLWFGLLKPTSFLLMTALPFSALKHYSHSLKGLGFSSSGKCGGFAWELSTCSALVLLYFALSAHLHL